AFRIMVGLGMLMLLVSWCAGWRLWRKGDISTPLAWVLVAMTFTGWVATLAGWYVTEIGRQPWLVTGVLTTAQAASKVPGGLIATTLAMYLAIYAVLIAAYISVLFHLAGKGLKSVASPTGAGAAKGSAPVHPVGATAKDT
ncbi:MAG: cytochrome ubiquinol oxidase subunit I, partial [Hyphomicrobiales bacterium]|nr:cytochrome ubiquinol oxidase subunit I [Hyphomicrobiales bacterium]